MLENRYDENSVEFVNCLRRFEKQLATIPWKLISPVEYQVSQNLKHIFSVYISIHQLTDRDVCTLIKIIHDNNISRQVKSLILSKLLFELDELNTERSNQLRRTILDDHLIKVIR
jgi:hypothetical protein